MTEFRVEMSREARANLTDIHAWIAELTQQVLTVGSAGALSAFIRLWKKSCCEQLLVRESGLGPGRCSERGRIVT